MGQVMLLVVQPMGRPETLPMEMTNEFTKTICSLHLLAAWNSACGAASRPPTPHAHFPSCRADPKAWEVEHVLAFLERLRPRFRDRTDLYRELFTDNDIDGAVLLGLNEDKLEKASGPAPSAASV